MAYATHPTVQPHPYQSSVETVFRKLRKLWTEGQEQGQEAESSDLVLATIPLLDTLSKFDQPCYSLIDMLEQRYLYLSHNQTLLTGYDLKTGYEGGMAWVFGIIHEQDLAPLLEINQVKWDFYRSLSDSKRPDFRANFDFRIRHAEGHYKRLIQQSICLKHTPQGSPWIILAKLHDITNLKPAVVPNYEPIPLLLTIHTGGQDQISMRSSPEGSTIWRKPLLSRREGELIKLLERGLSSRDIAEELGSSEATISTQRRNMLRKTGVVDTTALLSYARFLGWV